MDNFHDSITLQEIGLTILRVGIGLLFIGHGGFKIAGGKEELLWLGQQMGNLGITFAPLFWGLCATFAEFGGGIALTLGLCTRFFAALMICTMFVAVVHHIAKGDSYGYISFPLSQMLIFITFLIAGAGRYSLDASFWGR